MRHLNTGMSKWIAGNLNLKGESTDEVSEEIVLTQEIGKIPFNYATSKTTTGNLTITGVNLQTEKTFFLTGLHISWYKDVNCDIASGGSIEIYCYTKDTGANSTMPLLRYSVITLTAQAYEDFVQFPHPIELLNQAGTVLVVSGTFAAGALSRYIVVHGYHKDV